MASTLSPTPSAVGESVEAIRGGKPHGGVRTLRNRSNCIGRQTIGSAVGCKAAVPECTHPSIESACPHRSVTTLMYRINTILSESIGLGVVPGRNRATAHAKQREAASLFANPQFVSAA